MKKTITKLLSLAFALFASQGITAQSELLLDEPFAGSTGVFTVEGNNGVNNNIWFGEGDYIKAEAYGKIDAKEYLENYLVSPEINLGSDGVASFVYTWQYFSDYPNQTGFVVREVGGEWQSLPYKYVNEIMLGETGDIVIPESFNGKTIQVGFKYTSPGGPASGAWQIKNFKLYGVKADAKQSSDISYDVKESVFEMGSGDFKAPVLNNPYGVEVNYESSNTKVASVDASGNVTINGYGITTIQATSVETEQYASATASYVLTVVSPAMTEVLFCETFEQSLGEFKVEGNNGLNNNIWYHDIAFATADGYGKITEPVENYLVSPVIKLGNENYIAHYAQNQNYFNKFAKETSFVIRTVGGEWERLAQPNIPVKGDWSETGNIKIPAEYSGKEVQFGFRYSAQTSNSAGLWSISDFTVEKVLDGTNPEISYGVSEAVAFIGHEFTAPEINNPYGLELTYSSSNPEVATVDAQTGVVTIVAEGTTTIKAASMENDKYIAGEASYLLKVVKPTAEDVLFEAYFDDTFCGFSVEGFNGVEMPIWKIKNGCARADAYTKVSEPTTNYLVSPIITMSESENTAEFNYKFSHDADAKVAAEDEFGFYIREIGGEWESLVIPNFDATNTMVNSGKVIIPEAYAGKKVQVAFMYFAESGSTSGVLTVEDVIIRKSIPTGIEGISAEEIADSKAYDLQGRRVNKLTKGVFIVNGKKVVVK